MHEGLDHLRSIVVVPDGTPGVCAKTNAGEDTLIGPTQVVTTINFVAHGFGPAKNMNRGNTIQQEPITEFKTCRFNAICKTVSYHVSDFSLGPVETSNFTCTELNSYFSRLQ